MTQQITFHNESLAEEAVVIALKTALNRVDFEDDDTCVFKFPVLRTSTSVTALDATLVSTEKGVIAFDVVDTLVADYKKRQDDIYRELVSRFYRTPQLIKNRNLQTRINVVTLVLGHLPEINQEDEEYPTANPDSLPAVLRSLPRVSADDKQAVREATVSALQGVTTLRKTKPPRNTSKTDSRGARLQQYEDSLARLDGVQWQGTITQVKGVQRIRGLAGSGKSIALAWKAAYLHIINPEWDIAVTFYTRSLRDFFKRMIEKFYYDQTDDDPDWDKLQILPAWGSVRDLDDPGVYTKFCKAHGISALNYGAAKQRTNWWDDPFEKACSSALQEEDEKDGPKKLFDAILIDEAQDLAVSFLKLCQHSLDDNGMLVYAYDEMQHLGRESLPPPQEIFKQHPDVELPMLTSEMQRVP